jgi:diguanylate cyclase (GGDEF)-like protein
MGPNFGGNFAYIFFALFIVVTTLLMSWFALDSIKERKEVELAVQLKSTLDITNSALTDWISDRKVAARRLSERPDVRGHVKELLALPRDASVLRKSHAQKELRRIMGVYLKESADQGFFLIAQDHINIASMRDENLGLINLLEEHGDYLESLLGGNSELVLPLRSDVPLPGVTGKLSYNEPTMFVGVPVFDDAGRVIAAFTIRIDPYYGFTRIVQIARSGVSGEAYAFNREGVMISESRFDDHLREIGLIGKDQRAVLNVVLRNPGGNMLEGFRPKGDNNELPYTLAVSNALTGSSGYDIGGYLDYRGVNVIGSWVWNDNLGFGLVTELDVSEAYDSFNAIRRIVLTAIGLIIVLFVLFVFVLIGRNRKVEIINSQLEAEVNERKKAEKELELSVVTDYLTGVFNRVKFEEVIIQEIERFERYSHPLSVAILDIDFFKKVNDNCGHLEGDNVLKGISKVLNDTVRDVDYVVRWGGEEFMVIMPDTDLKKAEMVSERIRLGIELCDFGIAGTVTASFGVSGVRIGDAKDAFIKRADDALYRAKRTGRNRVVVAS